MAFEQSLLERIAQPEGAGGYKLKLNEDKLVDSVLEHLRKMLNVRHGSVPALPDYGLPDFNDLAMRFPDAILELRKAIKTCIEKYEPRLCKVKVDYIHDPEAPLHLHYDITAQLVVDGAKGNVWFQTTLDSAGKASIRG